ncbi:MAG: hypothetical protein JW839_07035 [Candidatus Lokiarchaeota archaeon]|nr:hypothetical protein [Candidatus Lokiarchaeota archaeon]
MAGSKLFAKVGRIFGEIGGQENIYKKNLQPATAGSEIPMTNLKAVPDDEIDPVQKMATSYKKVQSRQQLMSLICCITITVFVVLFFFLPE